MESVAKDVLTAGTGWTVHPVPEREGLCAHGLRLLVIEEADEMTCECLPEPWLWLEPHDQAARQAKWKGAYEV